MKVFILILNLNTFLISVYLFSLWIFSASACIFVTMCPYVSAIYEWKVKSFTNEIAINSISAACASIANQSISYMLEDQIKSQSWAEQFRKSRKTRKTQAEKQANFPHQLPWKHFFFITKTNAKLILRISFNYGATGRCLSVCPSATLQKIPTVFRVLC